MSALPPDYDTDPARWASRDPGWRVGGDVHEVVAETVAAQRLRPVLDVGSGRGRLREVLPDVSWDGPLLRLPDGAAISRYLRTHYLPASIAEQVTPPLTVTKRGCLVVAVNDA